MIEKLHTTPAGTVRFLDDGYQAIIISGKLSAIKNFLDVCPVKARVHVKNPLSKQLKGWNRDGDWVCSSTE